MSLEKMQALSASLRESMPESDDVKPIRAGGPAARGLAGGVARVSAAGLAAGSRRASLPGQDVTQLVADYDEVRGRYEELVRENERLKGDSRKRVETSLRREQRYEQELEGLRTELRVHKQKQGAETPMETLRSTHRAVLDGVASLKHRTASVLAEQERLRLPGTTSPSLRTRATHIHFRRALTHRPLPRPRPHPLRPHPLTRSCTRDSDLPRTFPPNPEARAPALPSSPPSPPRRSATCCAPSALGCTTCRSSWSESVPRRMTGRSSGSRSRARWARSSTGAGRRR